MYGFNGPPHLSCKRNHVLEITHTEAGTGFEKVTCSAKVGEPHNHPAIPKWVIELHLFRWACRLRLIQSECPKEVVESLAPSWSKFCKFTKSFLDKLVSSLIQFYKTFLTKRSKIPSIRVLYLFKTYCNEEQLDKFKQLLQSQQPYWPPSLHPSYSGKYCINCVLDYFENFISVTFV